MDATVVVSGAGEVESVPPSTLRPDLGRSTGPVSKLSDDGSPI